MSGTRIIPQKESAAAVATHEEDYDHTRPREESWSESTVSTEAATTFTAANLLSGQIARTFSVPSDYADTFPTPASVVAAIPNVAVGFSFQFTISNNSVSGWMQIIPFSQPTGATIPWAFIAPGQIYSFKCIITNITSGEEAYTVYNQTGALKLYDIPAVYESQFLPIGYFRDGTDPPDALEDIAATNIVAVRKFQGATSNQDAFYYVQNPYDAMAGKFFYRVFFLITEATAPDQEGVVFGLSVAQLADGSLLSTAQGTPVTVTKADMVDSASAWIASNAYVLTDRATPTTPNTLAYVVSAVNLAGGLSGVVEPTWPTTLGETVLDSDGVSTALTQGTGGTLYQVGDVCTLDGGNSDCTLQVDTVGGYLSSVAYSGPSGGTAIKTAGTGYNINDVLTMVGAKDSTATVKVTSLVAGAGSGVKKVATVNLDPGLHYDDSEVCQTTTAGGGSGCEIYAFVDATDGAIMTYTMLTGGTGYTDQAPYPLTGGSGSGAIDWLPNVLGVTWTCLGYTYPQNSIAVSPWSTEVALAWNWMNAPLILYLNRTQDDAADTYAQKVGVIGVELKWSRSLNTAPA